MRIALTLVLALALSSCVSNMGMLTTVSTSGALVDGPILATDVTGEDCLYTLLFFPLGKLNPQFPPAIRSAIRSVPDGVYMTDVEISSEQVSILFFSSTCLRVSGDVRGAPVALAE